MFTLNIKLDGNQSFSTPAPKGKTIDRQYNMFTLNIKLDGYQSFSTPPPEGEQLIEIKTIVHFK